MNYPYEALTGLQSRCIERNYALATTRLPTTPTATSWRVAHPLRQRSRGERLSLSLKLQRNHAEVLTKAEWRGSCRFHPRAKTLWFSATANRFLYFLSILMVSST